MIFLVAYLFKERRFYSLLVSLDISITDERISMEDVTGSDIFEKTDSFMWLK